MSSLRVDVYTSYDEEIDRTIIWQDAYLNDDIVQTLILGWYYGKPNDKLTEQFSHSTTVAQYY